MFVSVSEAGTWAVASQCVRGAQLSEISYVPDCVRECVTEISSQMTCVCERERLCV